MSLQTFIVVNDTQVKIEKERKRHVFCSRETSFSRNLLGPATAILRATAGQWITGWKFFFFSNSGPLTAELFANVRDILEEPDCPFCANSRQIHCVSSETVHVSCRNLPYFISTFFFSSVLYL
jgi:hypothetical protein